MEINDLCAVAGDASKEKGFVGSGRSFVEALALVIGEVSEAVEEWRNGHEPTEIYIKDGKPEGIPIELADTVIRIAQLCDEYDINLDAAIQQKLAFNLTRPFKHGGKRI